MGQGGFFLKKNNFFVGHIKRNSSKYIISAILFVIGIFIGAVSLIRMDIELCKELVDFFASSEKESSFSDVFKSCIISNAKCVLLYFVLSATIYTVWLSMLVAGVKGFFVGFTSAFLITNYAADGILYVLLATLPSAIIFLPVYCFASSTCVNFALDKWKRGGKGLRETLKIVPALILIFLFMNFCSLYDALVSTFVFKQLFL